MALQRRQDLHIDSIQRRQPSPAHRPALSAIGTIVPNLLANRNKPPAKDRQQMLKPASENLQGRKPRDGTRGGAAGAMEIWLPRMMWLIDGEWPQR
jgi:hypothetical protein